MNIFSLKKAVLCAASVLVLASCSSTKKVVMFQDLNNGASVTRPEPVIVTVRPYDKLSIVVNSKDPELAAIFNLPVITHQAGRNDGFTASNNQISVYSVDSKGNIDFPVLGSIHVAGMKREEVASMVKSLILKANLIKDPTVVVEFAEMYVTVLGDVLRPGRVTIDKDAFTVLDAIAKVGDINITAKRENIKLYREENGKQVCYSLDFTSAQDVYNSPVFYVHEDDIIYVEPNDMRVRQSTVNGNNLLSTAFWISVGSLLTSVATLIINAVK